MGVQRLPVEVDVDLALHPSFIEDGAHAGHALQRVGDLFVDNSVEVGAAFFRRDCHDEHRHHGAAELVNKGVFRSVGKVRLGKIDFLPDIVDRNIQVRGPVEYAIINGYVVL